MSLDIFSQPPRYRIFRGWLGEQAVERLLEFVHVNARDFDDSGVGYGEHSRIDTAVRRSWQLQNFGEFPALFEQRTTACLPEVFSQLGMAPFTPSRFEIELIAHGDGAFYSRHIDTYTRAGMTSHRVVSGVYYFHRQPKPFSGGELRLYALAKGDHTAAFVDVPPDNDTAVFFPSWFPHEVMPVRCPSGRFEDSRFAVNCWILQEL